MDTEYVLILFLYAARYGVAGTDLYAGFVQLMTGNLLGAAFFVVLGCGFAYWAYRDHCKFKSARRKRLLRDMTAGYDHWDFDH